MTNLDDPGAAMTTVHVERSEVLTLDLEGVLAFLRRCPEQNAAIVERAAAVNWRRGQKGASAVLALAFDG